MISETIVELSRWQFAITAMLHFLFIPLTLGLALLLACLETAYAWTGQGVYKAMARLWCRVFAINFVLAFATRLLVVFQFGMNGSYFSHYVGDVLALPLALEALTSFFIAAVLFGPYWFGHDTLASNARVFLAWVIAIATHLSAYWVLVANGWLQHPVGALFNYQSYRMELIDFSQLLSNPTAISKFIHTLAVSYVVSSATLLAISAYWLKRNTNERVAFTSYRIAAVVGLLALMVAAGLGDATSESNSLTQRAKQAAISAKEDRQLPSEVSTHIRSGIVAYELLEKLRDGNTEPSVQAEFEAKRADLGYALLLLPIHKKIVGANEKQISRAAQAAMPGYPALIYWAYRLMIAAGVMGLAGFALALWGGAKDKRLPNWLLNLGIFLSPVLWLACVFGWFVAEAGKQPWAIAGILPTFWGVSSLSVAQLLSSAVGYAIVYATLLGIGVFLIKQSVLRINFSNQGVV